MAKAFCAPGVSDRAQEAFEAYYRQKPDNFEKLFELAGEYIRAGEDSKGASVLVKVKDWMRTGRKERELCSQMDHLAAAYPDSLPLAGDRGTRL